MTGTVAEPGPKGRGIKRLAILGLLAFALLSGGIRALYRSDIPIVWLNIALWLLFFCLSILLIRRGTLRSFKLLHGVRFVAMAAVALFIIWLAPGDIVSGMVVFAKGFLGWELVFLLSSFVSVLSAAASQFLVVGGTLNERPERFGLFVIRIILIATALAIVLTLAGNALLLLFEAFPSIHYWLAAFLDGFLIQAIILPAYYFVIMGFVGETRPLWGRKGAR
ncbi:MAG: hypothetical protein LBG81_07165 [Coriobacteriaceae bacterium]|nr:hypothetical protein [Coriobacteriaceae bacterium]